MNKGWPKGVKRGPMSEEGRLARSLAQKGRIITWGDKISAARKGIATSIQKGDHRPDTVRAKIKAGFTDEGRERIRAANIGKVISEEHKNILRALRKKDGRNHFTGGPIADAFAEVLCRVGFVREYKFFYARGTNTNFQLDFAHVEGKVCIELDGKTHQKTQLYDRQRDEILRYFGWKVIHIKV